MNPNLMRKLVYNIFINAVPLMCILFFHAELPIALFAYFLWPAITLLLLTIALWVWKDAFKKLDFYEDEDDNKINTIMVHILISFILIGVVFTLVGLPIQAISDFSHYLSPINLWNTPISSIIFKVLLPLSIPALVFLIYEIRFIFFCNRGEINFLVMRWIWRTVIPVLILISLLGIGLHYQNPMDRSERPMMIIVLSFIIVVSVSNVLLDTLGFDSIMKRYLKK